MRHAFWAVRFCIAILLAAPSVALAKVGPWAETDQARVRLLSSQETLAEGQEGIRLGLEFELAEGWIIYWRAPGSVGMPPRIDFDAAARVQSAELSWPAPEYLFEAGSEARGYHNQALFPLDVALGRSEGAFIGAATVDYQICREVCIPQQVDLHILLGRGDGAWSDQAGRIAEWDSRTPQGNGTQGLTLETASLNGDTLRIGATSRLPWEAPLLSVVGPEGWVFETGGLARSGPAGTRTLEATVHREPWAEGELSLANLEILLGDGDRAVSAFGSQLANGPSVQASLVLVLGLAILGGLILNLMPCVLPVLSIKALGFVGKGGQATATVRRSFLATAAGILVSFWLLAGLLIAVQLAGGAATWGIQFQSPLFLGIMIALTGLFALNLLGLFEVPNIPGLSRIGNSGPAKDFLTGMLATALATPCTAPFLGTAVGVALASSAPTTLLIFTGLGLGMAVPYLLFAGAPGLARYLPRPGNWMNWLKRGLALLLLGTSLWLSSVLYGVLRPSETPAVGDELAAIAEPFDAAAIPALVAEGKTVFVDITARWCANCKVNEALALGRPSVLEALDDDAVVFMLADWTAPDADIAAYLQANAAIGIPFSKAYGPALPQGQILPLNLSRPSQVLDALSAVR